MLLDESAKFAGQGVGMGDASVVISALTARFGRVHQRRRQLDLVRIVAFVLHPRNVRIVRAEKEAERFGFVARGKELLDGVGIGGAYIGPVDEVEVVILRIIVVRHFADTRGFVAEGF